MVDASIRDLIYHCEMLDRMGMGPNSVMILHGGGVYESKDEAMKRFAVNFKRLPENVQKRLVLENDEVSVTYKPANC